MPELPEVESIKNTLAKTILGEEILAVDISWPPAIICPDGVDFAGFISGQIIESLGRRGKYLLIHLGNGWSMIVHFRMTGRLIFYPERHPADKHTHVIFFLKNGELHYSDIRKFGRIQLIPAHKIAEVSALKKMGPEPLAASFSFDGLGERLARKKGPVKAALLDQTVMAGLGNIYADEALFRAGIYPGRKTDSLKVSDVILLYDAVCEILTAGIEARGTSFRDYRDADGNRGNFQERLMVYGRGRQKCKICGSELLREKIAGRTTVSCPVCQK